jgi:CDP-6-deoxy-D-xylo-4-hexulose-3-dehydrase
MALTSPLLGERAIKRGDEVITVAMGFPTTITPILQYGAVPVFVDVTISQYNIDVDRLKQALSPKTKAVMLAHTLGNPFDLGYLKKFCTEHDLWLIEDNCDALGSKYMIDGEMTYTGTIGDIGTSSFYPAHHITTGEGGAVYTNNPLLGKIVNSMRDWGRDCICSPGQDNRCRHRFDGQFGDLPKGYDHKYVYSHLGYNLKATDMQAAIGISQMDKLPDFIRKRQRNYERLYAALKPAQESNRLILPEAAPNSEVSWFGFLMTCGEGVSRADVIEKLENKGIQTRMLFAGNITLQPCFEHLQNGKDYRISAYLTNTDRVMNDSFWVGVYPGLSDVMVDYMAKAILEAAGC